MASKKKAASTTLQGRISSLQLEAEKQIRAGLDRTLEMLPPEPRKAVKRLSADVDKARRDLRKRAEKAIKDVRKQAESFANEVQASIEKVVSPVTDRLAVASRSDLEALRKRVDHLEHRLEAKASGHPQHTAHAA